MSIPIRVNLTNQNFVCPTGLLPLDGVAGSTEPLAGGPPTSSDSGSFLSTGNDFFGGVFSKEYTYRRQFSFVQPASALDIADFTVPSLSASYINNVSSVSRSSTASFLAQEQTNLLGNNDYNLPHLTFTARNGEFIFDQMQNLPLVGNYCSNECNPVVNPVISGPATLCGSSTYTSPLQGQGYTYSWTASPAGAFTVSTGTGPTFQTSNVGNASSATISLTVSTGSPQSGCQYTYAKRLVVGAPQYSTTEQFDQADACNGVAHVRITSYDPSLAYTIRGYNATAINDRDGTFRLKAGSGQQNVAYSVQVSNNCGTQNTGPVDVDFTCPNNRYAVYPNPANDNVTVEQQASDGQAQRTAASPAPASLLTGPLFTVFLYDGYGVPQLQQVATSALLQLSVARLPAGLYLLRIQEVGGSIVDSRRLQITH